MSKKKCGEFHRCVCTSACEVIGCIFTKTVLRERYSKVLSDARALKNQVSMKTLLQELEKLQPPKVSQKQQSYYYCKLKYEGVNIDRINNEPKEAPVKTEAVM